MLIIMKYKKGEDQMQKNKQKRRMLAMLLTVVLLLCNLPLTGIAAASSNGKTDRGYAGLVRTS